MKRLLQLSFALFIGMSLMTSCGKKEQSSTTGWNYNDQKWGGFEKLDYEGQVTGPNLILIQGGTFTQGLADEDVTFEWNNVARRVTVNSFYMDETEVRNVDYREYLYWLDRVYGESYPEVVKNAAPDELVWRDELSYNEPLVENYFRHPSYDDYPVVGVNWVQANEYAYWRTNRVNEMILVEKGILNLNSEQKDEDNFDTKSYLAEQYQGDVRKNLKDIRTGEERSVKYEDGIMLPSYRLPTEAEWEYAAMALQGNMASEKDERITDKRIYPWDGNTVRYQKRNKYQGTILANFKRSGGDYMGMAGNLNDEAATPSGVGNYLPNDFGLYNMAGNVSEWCLDLYRPMTTLDLRDVDNHDLNPYRGNNFEVLELNEDGDPVEKDSLGRLKYRPQEDDEVANRDNYKKGKMYDFLDGDEQSEVTYDYGKTTLISDKARVIKGGSWADRAYWLSPGTRRFKEEDKADRTLGFRCAMIRNGGPTGNEDTSGKQFKTKKKKKKKKRFK